MAAEETSPNMSEDTPSTASSAQKSNGGVSNGSTQNHLKQKRARSQLSCTPCRQGKLKCNRQHDPACDQCIKRNRESACIFVPPPMKNKPAQNVKGRIRQLEDLVVDLMNQNQSKNTQSHASRPAGVEKRSNSSGENGVGDRTNGTQPGPFSQPTPPSDDDPSPQFTEQNRRFSTDSPDDVDSATAPFGQMRISKNEISYVGESHWNTILNSISDLKRDLSDDEEEEEDDAHDADGSVRGWGGVPGTGPLGGAQPHATTGLGFMVGEAKPVTRHQLISSVPEKRVADRLLSLWFNSPDPFKPIIHAPTFQDEYRRFWRNPKETPIMWLGLLYAILSLAASFGLRDINPSSPQAQAILADVNKYHSLAASAAVLADFSKPKQYTLECLILYAAGLRSNNAFVNVWLMIGLVLRLALRMGYHRDPSHYSIGAFHGEMRRRVWSITSMIDVLISFQLGLPSMVKTIQSDTQPPRNLLDRDFNSSTEVLPPSRGIDELTPSSYTRAKLRIVKVFADAAELSHATIEPTHEEVMRLDRELEDAKAAVPPLLQMPDISEVVTDPAEQLMCRFNLDLLYSKTKIVIHRRYMTTPFSQLTPKEQQFGIGTSRKYCLDSAQRVLHHHHTIYAASQTGGQLESVKWYMGSISTHDFLLAAMVICLELSQQINDESFRIISNNVDCPKRKSMMDALERSQQIWSDASGRKKKNVQFVAKDGLEKGEHMFDETEKASRAMAVMLEKVKAHLAARAARSPTPAPANGASDAPTPMNGMQQNAGMPPQSWGEQAGVTQYPFFGVVSNHPWSEIDGMMDDTSLMGGGQVFHNSAANSGSNVMTNEPVIFDGNVSNGTSQNQSLEATPNQQQQLNMNQGDFSMIGDMIDTANIDWEMWDNQIITRQQQGSLDWPEDVELSGGTAGNDMGMHMRLGNAASGGTGPVTPGNVIMRNGTGPMNQTYPGSSAHEFNMSIMDDIDFDNDFSKVMWTGDESQFEDFGAQMQQPATVA